MSLVTAGQICLYPPKPPPPTGNQTEPVFQAFVLTIICAFESLKQMMRSDGCWARLEQQLAVFEYKTSESQRH